MVKETECIAMHQTTSKDSSSQDQEEKNKSKKLSVLFFMPEICNDCVIKLEWISSSDPFNFGSFGFQSNIVSSSDEKQHQQRRQQDEHNSKLNNARSEKLSDLLNMAKFEADIETQKKREALEDLKQFVKELQQEEDLANWREAAATVKLLMKRNMEVRETLIMLEAIPALVMTIEMFRQLEIQVDV
ncbi:U-box domain-containing protein 7 [Sesbania bispinosa]|nr:U-box domain-containing protein 7 [Sesbania bispinosa]